MPRLANILSSRNMLKQLGVILSLSCLIFPIVFAASQHKVTVDGEIIGGDKTIIDHPYQANIEYKSVHQCGGAIIARTWVLTAAHCVNRHPLPEYFAVRVGTSFRELGGTVIPVAAIIINSNYSIFTFDFDICLLKLREPITLSKSVQIIGLPDNADPTPQGTIATIPRWVAIGQEASRTFILRVVETPVVDYNVCRDLYTKIKYTFTERMMCTAYWGGTSDICSGDGGAALIVNSKVIGVVSWNSGCDFYINPGVYTNVGVFRDWITEKTGI